MSGAFLLDINPKNHNIQEQKKTQQKKSKQMKKKSIKKSMELNVPQMNALILVYKYASFSVHLETQIKKIKEQYPPAADGIHSIPENSEETFFIKFFEDEEMTIRQNIHDAAKSKNYVAEEYDLVVRLNKAMTQIMQNAKITKK